MSEHQQHQKITVLLRKKFVSQFDEEGFDCSDSLYSKLCSTASFVKDFFSTGPSRQALANYEYVSSLDKLIHDSLGCIAGWEMDKIYDDRSILSYKCTTDYYTDADIDYIRNDWLEYIRDSADVKITDDLDVSGEIFVDFV